MKKLNIGDTCKYGHVLTEDNVHIVRHGIRCRICQINAVKKYYAKNRESILEKLRHKWKVSKKLRENNRALKKRYYGMNPEKFREKRNKWVKENKKKVRAYHSQPHMRIHNNISRSIRQAMKQRKNGRKWENIVGYSLKDLLIHLESLFVEDMSLDNYGKWEIDHVIPRSSFNFDKPDAIKECWKLENLQPLWMSDNRSKHARLSI